MAARPSRHLTERELRALSTSDLLDLIQQDMRDLDRTWRKRRKEAQVAATGHPVPKPGRDKLADILAELAEMQPPDDLATFHHVICCDSHLGDFPPMARVRCPFCEAWHGAGDFPVKNV